MPKVSIIILTYNSSLYISDLIKSINAKNPNAHDYEIIIIDNASTDDTLKKIEPFNDEIVIKKNESNFGFAKGINEGSRHAKGEYLLFINPDTKFEEGNINNLVSIFDKFENAGIVGGKLVDKKGYAEKSAGQFFGLTQIICARILNPQLISEL